MTITISHFSRFLIFNTALLFCLTIFILESYASKKDMPEYNCANIPKKLLENANTVIRFDKLEIIINDTKSFKENIKTVRTILNSNYKSDQEIVIFYNKFKEITNIKASIYDANGVFVREIKKEEINDYSYYADYTLLDDSRIKFISVYNPSVPYTIEYSYTANVSSLFFLRGNNLIKDKESLEHATVEVQVPKDQKINYYTTNVNANPIVTGEQLFTHYKWTFDTIPPITVQKSSYQVSSQLPRLEIISEQFVLDNIIGSNKSWFDFGKFIYELNLKSNDLDSSIVLGFEKLAQNTKDQISLIDSVYSFVQHSCRYVGIQLGISGYKSMTASDVNHNKYGDCKALSTYAKSILQACGIKAYYVLINNGDDAPPLLENKVFTQFNHVILVVPLGTDSIWLDCTDKYCSSNHISFSNENRKALAITPNGGYLINTPSSNWEKNTFKISSLIKINVTGDASYTAESICIGEAKNFFLSFYFAGDDNQRKLLVENKLRLKPGRIIQFNTSQPDAKQFITKIEMQNASDQATISGSRMIIPLGLEKFIPAYTDPGKNARLPVIINFPFQKEESMEFDIPVDYDIEALPENVVITSLIGAFKLNVTKKDDHTISVTNIFQLKDGIVHVADFKEATTFFKNINNSIKQKIILKKKS